LPGKKSKSSDKQQNRVRIIGGEWRGRKLDIANVPALRPTPDRIRETLFNWLQMQIPGSVCLDLFAGTGALGLEALSRGAKQVVFVDENPDVIQNLKNSVSILKTAAATIIKKDVTSWLNDKPDAFDIVFMDPPYRQGLVEPVCRKLEAGDWLSAKAWVFIEMETETALPALPDNWEIYRETKAGQASCYLIKREK